MSKKKTYLFTWVLAILALLLASCSSVTPTALPQPTQDPKIIQATVDAAKTEAVSTVIAEQTQNAPMVTSTTPPTAVPPTQTAEPTATVVTPTATKAFPTWTPGPSKTPMSIVCSIESASPTAGSPFPVKAPFDWRWKVKNTSNDTWRAADTDVKYLSGTKMHEGTDARDLSSDVAADGTYELILDMVAPETAGYYQETWGLTQGGTLLCAVTVNIRVTP